MDMSTTKALLFAVAAIAVISMMDASVKSLSGDASTLTILFFRQGVAAILLGTLALYKRSRFPTRAQLPLHFVRAMMIGATAFAFFYAVGELPLMLVTAIFMVAPILVSMMGVVFLKEEVTKTLVFGTLLGFAGAMVIVFGGSDGADFSASGDLWAWVAALLGPFGYALSIVVMKSQSRQADATTITFLQAGFIALVAAPFAVVQLDVPSVTIGLRLASVGFLGALGFLFYVSALRNLPASVFVLTENTALLWAAMFGFIFFMEVPALTTWVGAIMIIAACLLVGRQQVRRTPKR